MSSRPSLKESALAATAALKRPCECPPNRRGEIVPPTSFNFSRIARKMATEVVSTAGCVLCVVARSSSVLSKQSFATSIPSTLLASSKVARAASECSKTSLPMPGACDPWPGKTMAMGSVGVPDWSSGTVASVMRHLHGDGSTA